MKHFRKWLLPVLLVLSMLTGLLTGCSRDQIGAAADVAQAIAEDNGLIVEPENPEAFAGKDDNSADEGNDETGEAEDDSRIREDGSYTSKDEVAAYLHEFGHLPPNYITKNEAKDLGWDNSKGNLGAVAPGMSIGGDKFGNYEGQLPNVKGRKYYECDIDYPGHGSRNAKRIIYSNDGQIYYTDDHYNSFTLLYGEE